MIAKRKIKVGVVGCGVVATAYYLPCLLKMDTVDLVSVCDIYPERTAACVRLFGAREEYLDYYEIIEKSNVEFGMHITEMMWGALESSRTGKRYEITTKIPEPPQRSRPA